MNRGAKYQRWATSLVLATVATTMRAGAQDTKYVPDGVWQQLMIGAPPCLMLPKDVWESDSGTARSILTSCG